MELYDHDFWIIGGGRVGHIAVDRLLKRHGPEAFLVVDRERAPLLNFMETKVHVKCMDGIQFLAYRLAPAAPPRWIIPALPEHLAFEWIRLKLAATASVEMLPVPEWAVLGMPHPMKGKGGAVYASIADFRCPDDCPEPKNLCTHTGRPRPLVLHEHLAGLRKEGWRVVVIRSVQLAPGVGGFRPRALFDALARASEGPGRMLLATACKCHGVIHAYRVGGKP
ncbi:MAG: potassium transporter [Desulfobacterales bacterium]